MKNGKNSAISRKFARQRRTGAHQHVGIGESQKNRRHADNEGGQQRSVENAHIDRPVCDNGIIDETVFIFQAVGGKVQFMKTVFDHIAKADDQNADEQHCRQQKHPADRTLEAGRPQCRYKPFNAVEQLPAQPCPDDLIALHEPRWFPCRSQYLTPSGHEPMAGPDILALMPAIASQAGHRHKALPSGKRPEGRRYKEGSALEYFVEFGEPDRLVFNQHR